MRSLDQLCSRNIFSSVCVNGNIDFGHLTSQGKCEFASTIVKELSHPQDFKDLQIAFSHLFPHDLYLLRHSNDLGFLTYCLQTTASNILRDHHEPSMFLNTIANSDIPGTQSASDTALKVFELNPSESDSLKAWALEYPDLSLSDFSADCYTISSPIEGFSVGEDIQADHDEFCSKVIELESGDSISGDTLQSLLAEYGDNFAVYNTMYVRAEIMGNKEDNPLLTSKGFRRRYSARFAHNWLSKYFVFEGDSYLDSHRNNVIREVESDNIKKVLLLDATRNLLDRSKLLRLHVNGLRKQYAIWSKSVGTYLTSLPMLLSDFEGYGFCPQQNAVWALRHFWYKFRSLQGSCFKETPSKAILSLKKMIVTGLSSTEICHEEGKKKNYDTNSAVLLANLQIENPFAELIKEVYRMNDPAQIKQVLIAMNSIADSILHLSINVLRTQIKLKPVSYISDQSYFIHQPFYRKISVAAEHFKDFAMLETPEKIDVEYAAKMREASIHFLKLFVFFNDVMSSVINFSPTPKFADDWEIENIQIFDQLAFTFPLPNFESQVELMKIHQSESLQMSESEQLELEKELKLISSPSKMDEMNDTVSKKTKRDDKQKEINLSNAGGINDKKTFLRESDRVVKSHSYIDTPTTKTEEL